MVKIFRLPGEEKNKRRNQGEILGGMSVINYFLASMLDTLLRLSDRRDKNSRAKNNRRSIPRWWQTLIKLHARSEEAGLACKSRNLWSSRPSQFVVEIAFIFHKNSRSTQVVNEYIWTDYVVKMVSPISDLGQALFGVILTKTKYFIVGVKFLW